MSEQNNTSTNPIEINGEVLQFPQTFDLRIVYVLETGASIIDDLERIYTEQKVTCTIIQGVNKPGAKYGKMASRVTFISRDQMYSTYDVLSKLPYVKMVL